MTTPTVVLPQIITEAALPAGDPVPGSGVMTLDSASSGLLDTNWLATPDTWVDISQYVLNFTISRPSSRQVGPLFAFQQATATITIDNSSGWADPDNASGPYYGMIGPMVPVRVRANWAGVAYPLFRGFADSWTETAVDYSAGYSEWSIAATDGFKVLAGIYLAAVTTASGAGEDTGARIGRILNLAQWYSGFGPGGRDLDTGNSTLQATALGDYALNLMQVAADSEAGQLYVDGTGAVVFRRRQALISDARSNTSQATFGDQPTGSTELACAAISRADDDTTLVNDVQATRVGGTLQEVQNTASQAQYLFPRSYQRSDLILQDDPTALLWAQWVLYLSATPLSRFDSVTVDPAADPYALWAQVLGRDIGDRITVNKRPPPSLSTVISRQEFITGITHTFDAVSSAWSTVWTLADASAYSAGFLTLDNNPLGQLSTYALSF